MSSRYPLCEKLGLLVSENGLIYADKLEEILRNETIPVAFDKRYHDVVRLDAGFTKEYLENFPNKRIVLKNFKKD